MSKPDKLHVTAKRLRRLSKAQLCDVIFDLALQLQKARRQNRRLTSKS